MLGGTQSQRSRSCARTFAEIRVVSCRFYYPVVPAYFRKGNVQALPAAFPDSRGAVRGSLLAPVQRSPVLRVGVYHQERLETAFEGYWRGVLGHSAGLAHDVDGVSEGILVFQPVFDWVRHIHF